MHFLSQALGAYALPLCAESAVMGSRSAKVVEMVKKKPTYFYVDDPMPESGLYRVFHADHRVSHKAILPKGQKFPRCGVCKEEVHFELILAVPQLESDPNFRSFRVYEIPHKSDEEENSQASAAS